MTEKPIVLKKMLSRYMPFMVKKNISWVKKHMEIMLHQPPAKNSVFYLFAILTASTVKRFISSQFSASTRSAGAIQDPPTQATFFNAR